jgi:hypothetical protein
MFAAQLIKVIGDNSILAPFWLKVTKLLEPIIFDTSNGFTTTLNVAPVNEITLILVFQLLLKVEIFGRKIVQAAKVELTSIVISVNKLPYKSNGFTEYSFGTASAVVTFVYVP